MIKPEIKRLSYSSVALWNYCPRAWILRYEYGYRTPSSLAQIFGTAMHKTIQMSLLENKELSSCTDYFQDAFYKIMFESPTRARIIDATDDISMGIKLLDDPMTNGILKTIKVKAESQIEHEFEFRVPEVRPPVIGFIDILDNDGIPYDIKTSRWDWTHEKAMEETQPDFYLTALEHEGTPSPGNKFTYIIIKKYDPPSSYLIETERPNYKEKTYDLVSDMWKGVKSKLWELDCTRDACARCELAKECGKLNTWLV